MQSPERVERAQYELRDANADMRLRMPDVAETAVDARRQWEMELFDALDSEARDELHRLLQEIERQRAAVHSPSAR